MISPCKTCEKKGCGAYHSQCKPYLKYKRELERKKKFEAKQKSKIYYGEGRYLDEDNS